MSHQLPAMGKRELPIQSNGTLSEDIYKNETPYVNYFLSTDGNTEYWSYASQADASGNILVHRRVKSAVTGGTQYTQSKVRTTWALAIAGSVTGWVPIDDSRVM